MPGACQSLGLFCDTKTMNPFVVINLADEKCNKMKDAKTTNEVQKERRTQKISQAFEEYATAWTDFGVYKYGAK